MFFDVAILAMIRRLPLATLALLLCLSCGRPIPVQIPVSPSLEDLTADDRYFTPGTQSFLRGDHWLEGVTSITILERPDHKATVQFDGGEAPYFLKLVNMPMDYLVPRLHYRASEAPDAFDALNLRLAEFSRNGISVPVGKPGDAMAHFQSNLPETAPWRLEGDYESKPFGNTRPVRVGMVNNCLDPGLWELTAGDRAGEVYHAWFTMPSDRYVQMTARVNQVPVEFVTEALGWSEAEIPLDLDRLRTLVVQVGEVPLGIHREPLATGFSSQDSRRKLARGFAQVQDGERGDWREPESLDELTTGHARLTEFAPPGKYVLGSYKEFDLTFMRGVKSVQINRVEPKTFYDMKHGPSDAAPAFDYVELVLLLDGYRVVIGNLPLQLLSPREDFAINGFGVGVLNSSGLAERREFLFEQGPAPSFAYLAKESDAGPLALNSHVFGLEQIFLRTHLGEDGAWWECTITSYERIVDIIKYQVPVPDEMVAKVRQHALEYISPIYFTYRDDNLR